MDISENENTDAEIFFRPDEDTSIMNFKGYQVKPLNYDISDEDLKLIDNIFLIKNEHNIWVLMLIIILSIGLGFLSCLPLSSYNGNIELQTLFDIITRIIRAGCGFFIFTGCWYNFLDTLCITIYNNDKFETSDIFEDRFYYNIAKKFIILFFSALYSIPYIYTYMSKAYIPYVSIPAYGISLIQVFYQRTNEQFSSSSNSSSINRKRNILLSNVKLTIKRCKLKHESASKIVGALNNNHDDFKFSLMFAVDQSHIFYKEDKEELTSKYEDDNYDRWKSTRTTLLNLFLGVVYVALLITLINQYENLMVDIFIDYNTTSIHEKINVILWISLGISIIEGILFILATYSIYHNYLRKIFTLNNYIACRKQVIMIFIYSPMIAAGVILAMTRLQSSYIAFAKLATFLQLHHDMGFFLIGVGMSLSFLVEMCFMVRTSIHIINNLLRHILNSRLLSTCSYDVIKHQRNLALISSYGKRISTIIRDLSDDGINLMMRTVLQR